MRVRSRCSERGCCCYETQSRFDAKRQRCEEMETLLDGRSEMQKSALHEDETTRGASVMRDADKIFARESFSIVCMNAAECVGVEWLAIVVAADRDE